MRYFQAYISGQRELDTKANIRSTKSTAEVCKPGPPVAGVYIEKTAEGIV